MKTPSMSSDEIETVIHDVTAASNDDRDSSVFLFPIRKFGGRPKIKTADDRHTLALARQKSCTKLYGEGQK